MKGYYVPKFMNGVPWEHQWTMAEIAVLNAKQSYKLDSDCPHSQMRRVKLEGVGILPKSIQLIRDKASK